MDDAERTLLLERALQVTQRAFTVVDLLQEGAPVVYANPAFERMTGYPVREVLGKNVHFLEGPDTERATIEQATKAIENREPITVTMQLYRKDGSPFFAELAMAPMFEGQVVTHMTCCLVDVTSTVLASRDLQAVYASERQNRHRAQELSERLEAILTQLPLGVLIAEAPSARLLVMNDYAQQILRHPMIPVEQLEDYRKYGSFHLDGRPYAPEELPIVRSVMRGEEVTDEEIVTRRGDGTEGLLSVRSAPVRGLDGSIVAAICLFDDVTDRKAAEAELTRVRERAQALSHSLQKSLLPPALPVVEGLEFGASYNPLGEGLEVGGDFYDVFEQRDGGWVVVVGDVMGKGIEAATVTSLARHSMRTTALRARHPATMISMLNESLLREGSDRPFATVAVATFDLQSEGAHMVLSLGGHPSPLLVRTSGTIEPIGRHGTLVGVLAHAEVHEVEVDLLPGDLLIMFTDGATEARASNGEFLNDEGLLQMVRQLAWQELSAQAFADALRRSIMAFTGDTMKDDLAIFVTQVQPAPDRTSHL